ncbi:hypothetical protein AQUCO_00700498v1 [Aquilegia coerulea]|uniref:Uncharacterized protein n=1 Tax=Aquilegia coerulea TaxID=218851 RepID=A0A2G5EKD1_AQUCA|nr:hypothetical protein AQUCO_00700498v1 [Aquilegia coerulea]
MASSVSAPLFPSPSSNKKPVLPRNSSSLSSFYRISLPSLNPSSSIFFSTHRVSDSVLCRCDKRSDDSSSSEDKDKDKGGWKWNSRFQDMVKFVKRLENYLSTNALEIENVNVSVDLNLNLEEKKEVVKLNVEEEIEEWNWERWKKYFDEVEEQAKNVSVLKSQLGKAVYGEEYEYASKLKVAIAAAATNDVVGRVITQLKRAIEQERYQDAAFYRDHAGAGLMGWWAGISKGSDDPYGRIIHIGVEHGRYVARNFSPRHLATSARGVPLFEIFLTVGSKGDYKQQKKVSSNKHAKRLIRVPARLEKLDHSSFTFSVEEDEKQLEVGGKGLVSPDKGATLLGQRNMTNVMSDLTKYAMKLEEVPTKMLKELIILTLNQAKNRQTLSGTTTFNRIEIPASSDLLNGDLDYTLVPMGFTAQKSFI